MYEREKCRNEYSAGRTKKNWFCTFWGIKSAIDYIRNRGIDHMDVEVIIIGRVKRIKYKGNEQ